MYPTWYMAERERCAHPLRSFRLPFGSPNHPAFAGGFSSLTPIIYIKMHMAEREGFEPSIPF